MWRLDRDGPGAGTGGGSSRDGPGVTASGQLRPRRAAGGQRGLLAGPRREGWWTVVKQTGSGGPPSPLREGHDHRFSPSITSPGPGQRVPARLSSLWASPQQWVSSSGGFLAPREAQIWPIRFASTGVLPCGLHPCPMQPTGMGTPCSIRAELQAPDVACTRHTKGFTE